MAEIMVFTVSYQLQSVTNIFGVILLPFMQGSSKPLQSRFLLSDQVYCTADVPPTEKVMLWLGVRIYHI